MRVPKYDVEKSISLVDVFQIVSSQIVVLISTWFSVFVADVKNKHMEHARELLSVGPFWFLIAVSFLAFMQTESGTGMQGLCHEQLNMRAATLYIQFFAQQ